MKRSNIVNNTSILSFFKKKKTPSDSSGSQEIQENPEASRKQKYSSSVDEDNHLEYDASVLDLDKNKKFCNIEGETTNRDSKDDIKKSSITFHAQTFDIGELKKVKAVELVKENMKTLVAWFQAPFRRWKNAIEKFDVHSISDHHKINMVKADNFLQVMIGTKEDIASQVNQQRLKEREENRAALKPIVETILFCGEHELPLRGDNDSGPLTLEKPPQKDGKFRALLRFRANAGDNNLKNHILQSRKNATYVSPDIQNEVIEIGASLIQKSIVNKINSTECFSLLADETMDVSSTEQLSLCIRYVSQESGKHMLKEDFLGFVPVYDLTGENIAKCILEQCKSLGLDMEKCAGQGYDGAANMSGHEKGVHARIKDQYPKALYVHCASHRLNLALSDSMSIASVRNSLDIAREVISFFRKNSIACQTLKDAIQVYMPDCKKRRLLELCNTRFVERHTSVQNFVELLEPICVTLEEISSSSRKSSGTASAYLAALEKGSFLVSLLVCDKIFSITLPLSIFLQNEMYDLASAVRFSNQVIEVLQQLRDNAVDSFKEIFENASKLSSEIFNVELQVPRTTKRQKHRENPESSSAEEYYRISTFIPCLDKIINNLQERFSENQEFFYGFQILLPGFATPEKANELCSLSCYFLENSSLSVVQGEYMIWCNKLKEEKEGTCILKLLDNCNKSFLPNIYKLLITLATLPVTTCSVERTFSTMKRVKTLLRNRTGNERLSSLALLSAHWEILPNPDEVLDIMAKKQRRLIL